MSKYRILEKKSIKKELVTKYYTNYSIHGEEYEVPYTELVDVRRFIVQELIDSTNVFYDEYKDLKEFTNLDAARKYKRDLELEDGIVRE